jgi:hypothetical protein
MLRIKDWCIHRRTWTMPTHTQYTNDLQIYIISQSLCELPLKQLDRCEAMRYTSYAGICTSYPLRLLQFMVNVTFGSSSDMHWSDYEVARSVFHLDGHQYDPQTRDWHANTIHFLLYAILRGRRWYTIRNVSEDETCGCVPCGHSTICILLNFFTLHSLPHPFSDVFQFA